MRIWLVHHASAARRALSKLVSAPVNTLLFLLAIGVALALPAGAQMLLANVSRLDAGSPTQVQITVFMKASADRQAALDVEGRLGSHAGVKEVWFQSREATLQRMKRNPGLSEVIDALPINPFPDSFVVIASDESRSAMEALADDFRLWPKVEHVQLDSDWVRRLDAGLALGRTAVIIISALLGAGIVAIIFSIIRMQILTHRSEIELSLLLGATDGFIQRPFIYYGVFLGLGGGGIAWLLVGSATLLLRSPLSELASLYDLGFILQTMDLRDSALLLGFSALLAGVGAKISLWQQLGQP